MSLSLWQVGLLIVGTAAFFSYRAHARVDKIQALARLPDEVPADAAKEHRMTAMVFDLIMDATILIGVLVLVVRSVRWVWHHLIG